jgi:SAM-dependent methyltransferase
MWLAANGVKIMTEVFEMSSSKQTKRDQSVHPPLESAQALRQQTVALLRKLRLLPMVDELKLGLNVMKNRKRNKAFERLFPTEAFPPARLAIGAYARVDYEDYYEGGKRSAEVLLELMSGHIEPKGARILEWGCGPGRIVRHLAQLGQGLGMQVFGTDYDRASIEWCKSAIPGVTFAMNGLQPPLAFPDASFDVIYSSSVLTHLSEAMHYAWLRENLRVVKKNGLVIFTTGGDRMKDKLLPAEIRQYEAGELVVRRAPTEGSPRYNAFQSPAFVKHKLLPNIPGADLIRHETELPLASIQDIWVIRKH